MKRSKKINISLLIIILFVCFAIFGVSGKIFAAEETQTTNNVAVLDSIFDVKGINGEYKVSDEKSDIYLPFFRSAVEKVTIDKSLNKLGIISSSKTIEVNEPLENIQILFSADTVRVNNTMEYGVIWSKDDVVIKSDISRNAIIFAGGNITIDEKANIGDDVILVAKSVTINGKINGSAIVSAQEIKINGSIEKDLRCDVSNIEISSNDNIKGNLLINTYNKELSVADKYPNAILNIKETKSTAKNFGSRLLKSVINCLLFTLLYLVIKKITNGKLYENMLAKSKNNTLFVILSSSIYLLSFPVIFILLITLSAIGLYIITIPILIVYTAFLLVFWMISVFVVGSTIFEYMNKKYIKAQKLSIELVGVFFTFLSLTLLKKIPVVGTYINMAIVMVAIGIMIACILKRNKSKKETK